MRFNRIDLIAFGPFTGVGIDFSAGRYGLHVVFGPNEAGKSSTLRAITELLYGISSRTPDNFVHPYAKLRLGAELLHSDGTPLRFVRRKGLKNTLREEDDTTPMADRELGRFLGNVDRKLFGTMFGIDHAELRRGGHEIVSGGGQLGEMLFAAGAGLADLHKVRKRLMSDADALFKAGGRSGKIWDDLSAFSEARAETKRAQVTIDTWRSLDDQLQQGRQELERIDARIRDAATNRNRLQRFVQAQPVALQWRQACTDLDGVGEAPDLPDEFAEECSRDLSALESTRVQEAEVLDDLDKIGRDRDQLELSESLLAEADTIEALRDGLGGYLKAERDLPGLVEKQARAEAQTREILKRLGRVTGLDEVEQLRVPSDKKVRIQNLGNRHEGCVAALDSAIQEVDRLRREIRDAETERQGIPEGLGGDALQSELQRVQSEGDLERRFSEFDAARTRMAKEAEVQLAQLPHWERSLEECPSIAIPSDATVDRFESEWAEIAGDRRASTDRRNQAVADLEASDRQLRALELERPVPDPEQLAEARRRRDEGWALILGEWTGDPLTPLEVQAFVDRYPPARTLADAFAKSIARADQVSDQLLMDAEIVATKASLLADRERTEQSIRVLDAELEAIQARAESWTSAWNDVWRETGTTPQSPGEMRQWARRFHEVVRLARELDEKTTQTESVRDAIAAASTALRRALATAGRTDVPEDLSLNTLVGIATEEVARQRGHADRRRTLEDDLIDLRRDAEQAAERQTRAEFELNEWREKWGIEMSRLGLEPDAQPAQANSVLQELDQLFLELSEVSQFRGRVEGIEAEAAAFASQVRDVARRLDPELMDRGVAETVATLDRRLDDDKKSRDKIEDLGQRQRLKAERLDDIRQRRRDIEAKLEQKCRLAACHDATELVPTARRSARRRDLDKQRRERETQLAALSGGVDVGEFVAEVESSSGEHDAMQLRIQQLDDQLRSLQDERDESIKRTKGCEVELDAIDGASDAAEMAMQCESIAARLEERVRELAELRVAETLLRQGIEAYREHNQGPVLCRASELFARLTRGAFRELRADLDDRGDPVMTALRRSESVPLEVSGMSDGTCDQLYLALRLASLDAWLEHHEPLPFVVDDVLMNFDDDRAAAALEVLGDLSRRTQVIFFTHHQHLLDLARQSLSDDELFIHELER